MVTESSVLKDIPGTRVLFNADVTSTPEAYNAIPYLTVLDWTNHNKLHKSNYSPTP